MATSSSITSTQSRRIGPTIYLALIIMIFGTPVVLGGMEKLGNYLDSSAADQR